MRVVKNSDDCLMGPEGAIRRAINLHEGRDPQGVHVYMRSFFVRCVLMLENQCSVL